MDRLFGFLCFKRPVWHHLVLSDAVLRPMAMASRSVGREYGHPVCFSTMVIV
jgi:hypothetical protein